MTIVVGFDLDLTLVDSADGIAATFVQACGDLGVDIAAADVRPMIGLPLEETMRHFVPAEFVAQAAQRYRELYPTVGVPAAKPMPGADETIAAVHRHDGRVLVITAKVESAAHALIGHVGLAVDDVSGDRYGAAKGQALREHNAIAHVGDHPGDMAGAQAAGTLAVGVTTGSHSASALRAAGADVVLPDLLGFPDWLDDLVRQRSS